MDLPKPDLMIKWFVKKNCSCNLLYESILERLNRVKMTFSCIIVIKRGETVKICFFIHTPSERRKSSPSSPDPSFNSIKTSSNNEIVLATQVVIGIKHTKPYCYF